MSAKNQNEQAVTLLAVKLNSFHFKLKVKSKYLRGFTYDFKLKGFLHNVRVEEKENAQKKKV